MRAQLYSDSLACARDAICEVLERRRESCDDLVLFRHVLLDEERTNLFLLEFLGVVVDVVLHVVGLSLLPGVHVGVDQAAADDLGLAALETLQKPWVVWVVEWGWWAHIAARLMSSDIHLI